MTEAEWLACEDALRMWRHTEPSRLHAHTPRTRGRSRVAVSRRTATLFAAACVRATPQAADDAFLQRVLGVVESSADGGDWAAVDAVAREAGKRCGRHGLDTVAHFWELAALRLADDNIDYYAIHVPQFLLDALKGAENVPDLRRASAGALRDVVGNPFRGGRGRWMKKPTKRHPSPVLVEGHVSPTAVAIARGMYGSRDFSAMPILADALQDAGCDSDDILSHCRDERQVHVRGCWVVDLVLGKS